MKTRERKNNNQSGGGWVLGRVKVRKRHDSHCGGARENGRFREKFKGPNPARAKEENA